MKVYNYCLKNGISRTKEFEKKRLAEYAVNIGLKCGHGCEYCSTCAMLRTHKAFKELGVSPFENNYAVIDPDTPNRIARDASRKRQRGLVQLCTIVDAWSPEAQQYQLGRRCLEAVLSQPGWTVRVLTKNAAIKNDFDVIERYKDRVLVGLSITALPDKDNIISVIEPNASLIKERMEVMSKAAHQGFRTYAMFCPILPGIADSPEQIENLIKLACQFKAEEIFAEAVNPRGRGLILTQEALKSHGYPCEAACIEKIRYKENWSQYVVRLIKNIQRSVRKHYDIEKLRFLLYPGRLEKQDLVRIQQDDEGVIWL
ncbi:MAG: DNA photolyase [Planctomycetota bacterium]|nr:DNA photolyase [Planctomycetota bacterium]